MSLFDHVSFIVERYEESSTGPSAACDELTCRHLRIGSHVPGLDTLLAWLSIVIVDFVERQLDRVPSTGLPERRSALLMTRIASANITAIDPRGDLKRLSCNNHFTRSNDGAPRFVDHLGGDAVFMVLIAVQLALARAVSISNFERTIFADFRFAIENTFGGADRRPHHGGIGRMQPQERQPGYHT